VGIAERISSGHDWSIVVRKATVAHWVSNLVTYKRDLEVGAHMLKKTINGFAWILALYAIVAAAPALAADASDWAARAAIWEKEFNAGHLKGVVALYAVDGCRMPPNAKTVQDSEAILASLQSAKEHDVAKVKVAVTSAETSGNLSYATGTFEVLGADGKSLDHGKWMGVSKKLHGKWRTQCDIWNSDMPMQSDKAK
jgi:ketosteroid isomerase-like protein